MGREEEEREGGGARVKELNFPFPVPFTPCFLFENFV